MKYLYIRLLSSSRLRSLFFCDWLYATT